MPTANQLLQNLRIAALESRRGDELAASIAAHGGVPMIAPALREVTPPRNPEAIDFANRLITGLIETVIFTTGSGVRRLIEQVSRHVDSAQFLAALSDVTTIARGPKPVAALAEVGLTPTHVTAAPHTWREILNLIDARSPVVNQTVGLQEYGEPNASLLAGLEARGAAVVNLRLYRWELPEDLAPLETLIRTIAAGDIDMLLVTSSQQVVHLLHVAEKMNAAAALRSGLRSAAIGAIGPDTAATLKQHELPVDFEPPQTTLESLVQTAADNAEELLGRKRWLQSSGGQSSSLQSIHRDEASRRMVTSENQIDMNDPAQQSAFMKACRREPVPHTPIWLMRQAGRYMQEYREVRAKVSFLELCKNPALCAEVMIAAVNRLGVDAAIIFSDLLPILEPLGLELEFAHSEGPVIHNPVREARDVDRVRELADVQSLDFVYETVRQTRAGLPGIPIIGFAGSPFTLASYVIEGGASRNYLYTKGLMYRDTGAWNVLLSRLARAVAKYLNAQIAAGAHAVQLFDSWAGCLGVDDYRRFVLPHMQAIFAELPPHVPVINFATGNPALLPLLAEADAAPRRGEAGATSVLDGEKIPAVIGIDWRVRLDDAWRAVGHGRAVQGNLDPAVLLADVPTIRRHAREVLDQAGGRAGHIFNVGHGIVPQTPVENVIALVQMVQEMSAR